MRATRRRSRTRGRRRRTIWRRSTPRQPPPGRANWSPTKKDLDGGAWKTRIAEPKPRGFSRWHGDDKARAAVYANRTRLGSDVGKQAMRRRAEIVERSFAHNLDRGGMRRTWLRGLSKCSQALPGPRRWPQARHSDAAADRSRNPQRGGCPRAGLSVRRLHRPDRGVDPYRRVLRRSRNLGDGCR